MLAERWHKDIDYRHEQLWLSFKDLPWNTLRIVEHLPPAADKRSKRWFKWKYVQHRAWLLHAEAH